MYRELNDTVGRINGTNRNQEIVIPGVSASSRQRADNAFLRNYKRDATSGRCRATFATFTYLVTEGMRLIALDSRDSSRLINVH